MSMICTPLSAQAATMPYVLPPTLYTSTSAAPPSAPNPPEPSNAADTGAGSSGYVMSMICTPSSSKAATMPYVFLSMLNTSTSFAPPSASNPPEPSNAADTGAGSSGSVMSMICTPLSAQAATMPYVLPPTLYTSTSAAPPSAPNPPEPSNAADTGAGSSGYVMSMICTPSSSKAATMPYVFLSMLNTSTSFAPPSASNPPEPSNAADTGAGSSGSVMSMICTPLSNQAATMAYVRFSTSYTSTSAVQPRASNPPEPSNTADTWAGRAGSLMSTICTPALYSAANMAYVRSPTSYTPTLFTRVSALNPSYPSNIADTGVGSPATGFTCPTDTGENPVAAAIDNANSGSSHFSTSELCRTWLYVLQI